MDDQAKFLKSYFSTLQMELITAKRQTMQKNWNKCARKYSYNRFYFIVDGECWIKIGDQEFHAAPGQLYLIPRDTVLAYSTINEQSFEKYWCHFAAKVGSHNLFPMLKLPHCIQVHDVGVVEQIFDGLLESNQRRDDITFPLKERYLLLQLFTYFVEQAASQSTLLFSAPLDLKFSRILKFIEEHISEPLTLEKLAKVFNYNPNYFIRYFKTMFNMSPKQYINKIRMEKAKKLLVHSQLSLGQIASEVGWERFYFSKTFKQCTSFSPSDYRKMNQ